MRLNNVCWMIPEENQTKYIRYHSEYIDPRDLSTQMEIKKFKDNGFVVDLSRGVHGWFYIIQGLKVNKHLLVNQNETV